MKNLLAIAFLALAVAAESMMETQVINHGTGEPRETGNDNIVLMILTFLPLLVGIIATIFFIITGIMMCVRGGRKLEPASGVEMQSK